MKKRVLIIAAHPDDELLGCGGTIVCHTNVGDTVKSIIVCEGESMRGQDNSSKISATMEASRILGVSETICLSLPDQHLDSLSLVDVINPIEKIVKDFKPNIVYTHFKNDINRDHQIIFQASMVALRPKVRYLEKIYSFYTVSSSEWNYPYAFIPDTFMELDEEVVDKKIKAFSCYDTEICEYPHPRSMEGLKNLAAFTGNQCCMKYAEGFITIRNIIRSENF